MQKFRLSSSVFEKPGILSEKLKTLTSSNYHKVEYFLLKFCTYILLTTNGHKFCSHYFYFVQILSCLQKNKKSSDFYIFTETRFFTFSLITLDLNRFTKIPNTRRGEMGVKYQQNILNFVVVGARQCCLFLRKITWFLGNNRILSKFRYRILYYVISINEAIFFLD